MRLPKRNQIPESITENKALQADINKLPTNYKFEIHKIIHHITSKNYKLTALQFPEGLLMFASTISDIITNHTDSKTLIMADVTYGACCIDDYTALALNCDFLVHFGHSCLIPISITRIKTLYIFVEIEINLVNLYETVLQNLKGNIAIVSTVQFISSLHSLKSRLKDCNEIQITIPQALPLSSGEILGCTSPILTNIDAILYIGDGRFHLESIMISNPGIKAYKYDPYSLKFTIERYDHVEMKSLRTRAIDSASCAKKWGVIVGTLGRQGSNSVFEV